MTFWTSRHRTTLSLFKRYRSGPSPAIIPISRHICHRTVLLHPKHYEPSRVVLLLAVRPSRRYLASAPDKNVATTTTTTTAAKTPTTDPENDVAPVPTTAIIPIDFDTSSSIEGEESQILQVRLKPNQVLRAESGAMLFMTQDVEMDTSLTTNPNGGSAVREGFQRMMTGQNLFFSDYTYRGEEGTTGTVALGTDFPSKILRFSLGEYGSKIVCQKGALLASSTDVEVRMEFTKKFTAGFFGGEGFVLQGLVGEGDVFCKAGGTVVRKELREGETIRVSSGCLVAFTQDVEYGKGNLRSAPPTCEN